LGVVSRKIVSIGTREAWIDRVEFVGAVSLRRWWRMSYDEGLVVRIVQMVEDEVQPARLKGRSQKNERPSEES
jgi:hypothetical protein